MNGTETAPLRRPMTMARYRFLNGLGDVVAENEFPDHATAIDAVATLEEDVDEDIMRVEYLGPAGDWRWAGPLNA